MTPSEPYGPWIRRLAEATFLDASRWLDVAYVLVALPLAAIEFTVAVTLWSRVRGAPPDAADPGAPAARRP